MKKKTRSSQEEEGMRGSQLMSPDIYKPWLDERKRTTDDALLALGIAL
jgi:hypothetical protein